MQGVDHSSQICSYAKTIELTIMVSHFQDNMRPIELINNPDKTPHYGEMYNNNEVFDRSIKFV